jgi:hypothetical protein
MSFISDVVGTVLSENKKAIFGGVAAASLGILGAKLHEKSLGLAIKAAQLAMSNAKGDSLVSFTQAARVEPILLMDQKAIYLPYIHDVVHTMNSLFTAYYLQAVALDTTLSGVKVLKRLDKFNPDRNLSEATTAFFSPESRNIGMPVMGRNLGLEAYGPAFENQNQKKPRALLSDAELELAIKVAMQEDDVKQSVRDGGLQRKMELDAAEADAKRQIQEGLDTPERREAKALADAAIKARVETAFPKDTPEQRMKRALEDAEIRKFVEDTYAKIPPVVSSISTKDVSKMVTDVANLAVGKVIEVTITENEHTARIPVTIRMRVTSMPSPVLVETLAVGGVDVTAGSRWKAFRAGELGFWSDIVLAQDRIDAHRNAIRKDTSGYYNAVYQRANKNLSAELLGAGPSVGNASAIIVLTEQTRQDLERKIGGRLSDYKTRQNIFINTFSMLMCVVDPEWETVTIFHRGIRMPTELNIKYITSSAKGTGPDVAEIMKAYQLGNAPHRL